jgi:hypothetical protein
VCDRLDPRLAMALVNRTKQDKAMGGDPCSTHAHHPAFTNFQSSRPICTWWEQTAPSTLPSWTTKSAPRPPLESIGQEARAEGAVAAARGVSNISAVLCPPERPGPTAARLHNRDYQSRGKYLLLSALGLWIGNLGPRRCHAFARYKQPPRNRHIPDPVIWEFRSSVSLLGNATAIPRNFIPSKHNDAA